jgi:hypothetical protein
MNTPEFEDFVNHWTGCRNCRPRHDIYCGWGRKLWIDDKAAFIADLETLGERQYWLAQTQKISPQYVERIKEAVIEKFKLKVVS